MSLRSSRRALLERTDLRGPDFCAAFSDAADSELTSLLENAAGGDLEGLALLAVGGYGRGELCPHSDLDVVLVHRQRRDVKTVADAVWYPVWDDGIRLDYSVRSPAEVLSMAGSDLRVQLGLLDGRVVAGDPDVGEPVLARAREVWRSRAAQWLPVLAEQVAVRHVKYGDVAFLLEPNLKEAHGGLRDLSGLHAAVMAAPALSREEDLARAQPSRRALLLARVELQRRASRPVEKLLLQDQDAVASALDYSDADALMSDVAEAGRTVAWLGDDVWSRPALWQVTRKRRRWLPGGASDQSDPAAEMDPRGLREVESGIGISAGSGGRRNGEVLHTSVPGMDATLVFRLAAVAAEQDLAINRTSLQDLALSEIPTPRPWPEAVRSAFVRVLAAGTPAIRALEALDHYGILSRLVPEWDRVRNKPQRNAYHRFTVDRHLLEAAARAAALTDWVSRPDLLLVAALVHDIGKGYSGDHVDAGVEVVGELAGRMGFAPRDVEVIVNLVRNHLLLSELATRRDLDDPATIDAVSQAVGDSQTLGLLAALTEADSLATGPAAWGNWKAGLVYELVRRTQLALEGDELPPTAAALLNAEHRAVMATVRELGESARPVLSADGNKVTVVARDEPGLLARVSGVMSLHGLDVRAADVAGEDGIAIEVFVVEPAFGRWPDLARLDSDLVSALRGETSVGEKLSKKQSDYHRRRPLTPWESEVVVTVDNGASSGSTIVEVRAPDEIALLHTVTRILFESSLDVVAARAATLGDSVVDAFYVRDHFTGDKVTDAKRLERLAARIREALAAHSEAAG